MILNIIISLSSIFPKAIDTAYINSDSVVYFENYKCSKTIAENCLYSKVFNYENFKNLINDTNYNNYKNLDTFACNDGEVRNVIMGFFMNKFVGKLKNSTTKDSLDFTNLLKIKSKIAFIGSYQTKKDSIKHLIYTAFFSSIISENNKYIFPSFADFIFVTNINKNKIASIVALKAQVGYSHYYSKFNGDGTFTAYEPLDAPDVSVDMNSLSSEEKKEYLEENNNLEIRYSKYKIDENGHVVLFKNN